VRLWSLIVVIVLAVGAVACGGGETAAQPDLRIVDFSFQPAELTVAAGEEVAWTVTNDDSTPHNLTAEGLGIDVDVDGGAGVDAQFTTGEPGDFPFFCAFHPEQMTGRITVE